MTFEERYCREHRCDVATFRRRLFWRSLPLPQRGVARLIAGVRPRFFEVDWRYIAGLGESRSLADVRSETREFLFEHSSLPWARRVLKLRVSTARATRLARRYVPEVKAAEPRTPFAAGRPGIGPARTG